MAKKQFKAESKRLLDLMINSIYTHHEIFLRELISNASDAIDKLCYMSITDERAGVSREDFKITVTADKEKRTLTVSDNGIGMTEEELENNLGVIARSGSLHFKEEVMDKVSEEDNIDIIGRFGVGFYSAFMIAEKVTVISKSFGAEKANKWTSSGADGYTVTEAEKEGCGTDIIMELKPDTENENYSQYLEDWQIKSLIKKYSDYIRWPIIFDGETINSMVPVWQKSKSEVSDEDCVKFYKDTFHDMSDPVAVVRTNAEGAVSFKSMLFIPENPPYDFYTTSFKPGLKLYASGVMIMEKCSELLPDCFRFVQGIVDSPDLSLNISREILQHDRQLKIIAGNLEKKIKAELKKLMDTDREKYEKFYKNFGVTLKYGLVNNFGMKKELLSDLLLYWSDSAGKLISLKEYADNMPESQKYIYYASGESVQAAAGLPQNEQVKDKGYDILYLTEGVDEFVVKILGTFAEKEFKSVNDEDLGLETEEEKQNTEKLEEESREMLDFISGALDGKIAAAKISKKLKSHPVCLSTQGSVTLEMERYFNSVPSPEGQAVKAERVLEINGSHPVFEALKNAYDSDKDKAKKYSRLLYDQALLIAGLPLEDPSEFSDLVCELMK